MTPQMMFLMSYFILVIVFEKIMEIINTEGLRYSEVFFKVQIIIIGMIYLVSYMVSYNHLG